MILPLTRRRTSWAAYCDECLIGSPVIVFDAPHLARAWTVEKLRGLGWTHVAARGLPPDGLKLAESAWTGETFCFECSAVRARRRA